jgi:hypothetical protein
MVVDLHINISNLHNEFKDNIISDEINVIYFLKLVRLGHMEAIYLLSKTK